MFKRAHAIGAMLAILLAAGWAGPRPALGQVEKPDLGMSKSSESLRRVFKDVVAAADNATVVVEGKTDAGKVGQLALGTVVSADGYILTKASEVAGRADLKVVIGGKAMDAKVVGVSEPQDLGMLKVDATGLAVAPWAYDKGKTTIEVGEWVASAGQRSSADEPIAVGVVSVGRRRIPPRSGYMGVELRLRDDGDGAQIEYVFPGSAADKAGMRMDDKVTAVNGKAIKDKNALILAMRSYRPGDVVALSIKRGNKTLQMTLNLGADVNPEARHMNTMELMEGPVSRRSSDFRAVFQHDTVLRPMDCGGPVVDLTGKVIGINIARAGRTDTYALPADVVLPLIAPLESGKLAPAQAAPAAVRAALPQHGG